MRACVHGLNLFAHASGFATAARARRTVGGRLFAALLRTACAATSLFDFSVRISIRACVHGLAHLFQMLALPRGEEVPKSPSLSSVINLSAVIPAAVASRDPFAPSSCSGRSCEGNGANKFRLHFLTGSMDPGLHGNRGDDRVCGTLHYSRDAFSVRVMRFLRMIRPKSHVFTRKIWARPTLVQILRFPRHWLGQRGI